MSSFIGSNQDFRILWTSFNLFSTHAARISTFEVASRMGITLHSFPSILAPSGWGKVNEECVLRRGYLYPSSRMSISTLTFSTLLA